MDTQRTNTSSSCRNGREWGVGLGWVGPTAGLTHCPFHELRPYQGAVTGQGPSQPGWLMAGTVGEERPDFSVWSLLPSRAAGLNPTVLWDPCLYVLSCFSRVLFATPWTVVHQAPQSMGFPRQEHCSGLPFPSQGDPPDPGIKQMSPASPALAGRFFTTAPPGTPQRMPEEPQKPPPSLQLQGFCLTKVEVGPGTRNLSSRMILGEDNLECPDGIPSSCAWVSGSGP